MICYVVNLERHEARLQSFLEQFDRSDLNALELRRFPAVDAASVWPAARALVSESALAKLAVVERRGFRQAHAELSSKGAVGCALSHMCIWLDILYDSATPTSQRYLVTEDDAILPRRLLASVNKALQGVPADWDILLLGCRIPQRSMVTKYTTHVDIQVFQGTHAYLVSKAAVRKVFENGALPMSVQIDAYLSGLSQAKKLKIYALPKRLAGVQNRWPSSTQLDYDFERSHARLTYQYPFEMASGPTSEACLQRLDAFRVRAGLSQLRLAGIRAQEWSKTVADPQLLALPTILALSSVDTHTQSVEARL
jgi:GR25 family glycosyltransferase involved in LPS biosynthesis